MLENIYIANSGLVGQERVVDTVANNLANLQTPGFKRDEARFRPFAETLQVILGGGPGRRIPGRPIGTTSFGVLSDEMTTAMADGPLRQTGRNLDLALAGPGFFVVDSPQGQLYTRSGRFMLDAAGRLVTERGYPVLGQDAPLVVGGEDGVAVRPDGSVWRGERPLGKLRLVTFAAAGDLRKAGDGYFTAPAGAEQDAPPDTRVLDGNLEDSNVNYALEVTRLMEAQNAYTINARVLQVLDNLAGRAADELGRSR